MFHFDLSWLAIFLSTACAFCLVLDAVNRARLGVATLGEHWLWALATAAVFLSHQMAIKLSGDVQLHYMGGALLAILLGYPRALLSMTLVLLGTALAEGSTETLGLQVVFSGALPAATMVILARLAEKHLPRNLFVFLLGTGFLGLFAVYALEHLAALTVRGLITGASLAADISAYALLLASGEAWLEGMIVTVLVVYAPGAVRLFDQSLYLQTRRPGQSG